MARLRGIEKRLFEAVVLVLANGCWAAPEPQPPVAPPPAPPSQDVATDPWARPPLSNPPTHGHSHTQASSPATPQEICTAHRRTTIAPTKIPPVPPSPAQGPPISETSHWGAGQQTARCTIVRERRTTNITVTYTPRCCPMPDVDRPCPGPQTSTAKGALVLVERADVALDGTVLASNLHWKAIEPYRERQPYCGRLPEGAHALGDLEANGALAHHLAVMAELEAASVPAFERLARELATHGAPADLVRRALAAMRDEIRHARTMRALAEKHGASPRAVAVEDLPCRSLEAIALENVVEGCVREAYGALVATYQAERAPADVRRVFRAIARDERRHAALAEDVHAWIAERLDAGARIRVATARATAEAELRTSIPAMPRCDDLGMPDAPVALALFDAYFAAA
ncbi:MAG: ferritin-like domain-containing protein [Kofleriaceae bacterium]